MYAKPCYLNLSHFNLPFNNGPILLKNASSSFFFKCFWAKHDSSNIYLKNRLIQNRLSQRRFFV